MKTHKLIAAFTLLTVALATQVNAESLETAFASLNQTSEPKKPISVSLNQTSELNRPIQSSELSINSTSGLNRPIQSSELSIPGRNFKKMLFQSPTPKNNQYDNLAQISSVQSIEIKILNNNYKDIAALHDNTQKFEKKHGRGKILQGKPIAGVRKYRQETALSKNALSTILNNIRIAQEAIDKQIDKGLNHYDTHKSGINSKLQEALTGLNMVDETPKSGIDSKLQETLTGLKSNNKIQGNRDGIDKMLSKVHKNRRGNNNTVLAS